MTDSHLHTAFSADSTESLLAYAQKADKSGFSYIAVTDHIDNEFFPEKGQRFDFNKYFETIEYARQKYPVLKIAAGIEIGYAAACNSINKKIVECYPFDLVINSIHSVNGGDCYYAESFAGKDRDAIYTDYFDAVLESLSAPYYFSHIGHLGYVMRNAPYKNKLAKACEFGAVFTKIFKLMIEKGIILELNTSTCGTGTLTIPTQEHLKMYYDLGGRLISFGSDAHTAEKLGNKYHETAILAKSIGFTHFTVVYGRKKEFIKI